jgi:hypothetical protein
LIIGDFGLADGSAGLELDRRDLTPGCYGFDLRTDATTFAFPRVASLASFLGLRFMSLLAPHPGGRQGLDVADLMLAPKRRCCDFVKQAQPD